jgi:cysteinyl-tRNA synthetase
MDYKYFLLGSHYRKQLMFSDEGMDSARTAYQKLKERTLALEEAIETEAYLDQFKAALADDLNTANALTLLYAVLKDDSLKSGEKRYIIQQMDTVLGLDLFREKEHDLDVETIERLIAERNTAKSEKNWARADEIRQQLIDMGISIMDGKDGTTWKVN